MKRYFAIFAHLFGFNVMREMEFRENFLLLFTIQSVWTIIQLLLVEVLFQNTNNLIGWTKIEALALIGLYRVIKGVFDTFLFPNVLYMPENINRGRLDFNLTKPINPLFLTSVQHHFPENLGPIIAGLCVLIYAVISAKITVGILFIVNLVMGIIFGVVAFYSLLFGLALTAFFTERLTALSSFYDMFNNALRNPLDVYTRKNLIADLLLLPLALVVTLPTKIIFSKVTPAYLTLEVLGALLMFTCVYKFWLFALRHYSSASS